MIRERGYYGYPNSQLAWGRCPVGRGASLIWMMRVSDWLRPPYKLGYQFLWWTSLPFLSTSTIEYFWMWWMWWRLHSWPSETLPIPSTASSSSEFPALIKSVVFAFFVSILGQDFNLVSTFFRIYNHPSSISRNQAVIAKHRSPFSVQFLRNQAKKIA
jgi:hypothetical protein